MYTQDFAFLYTSRHCRSGNFRVFKFLRICDLRFFWKSAIRELSISMISSAHDNISREILKFANLSSSRDSRKLKPLEYYQIYSILDNNTSQV